jgi:hypothetical protein
VLLEHGRAVGQRERGLLQRATHLPAVDVERRDDPDVSWRVAADLGVAQAMSLLGAGAVVLEPLQQGTCTIADACDCQSDLSHDIPPLSQVPRVATTQGPRNTQDEFAAVVKNGLDSTVIPYPQAPNLVKPPA